MATSPIGPVLVIPCAIHCLLISDPPSPRRSIVWMIEDRTFGEYMYDWRSRR